MDSDLVNRFEAAVRRDGRYPPEAFEFLQRGLELATRQQHGSADGPPQHVTGQELCQALRELAIELWGPFAREVLRRWNIRTTRDFGEMVYLMIEIEMMGRQDSDDIRDFDDVFDFRAAFDGYTIRLDPGKGDPSEESGDES